MTSAEFHPDRFARGQKYTLDLEGGEGAHDVVLPVLLVRGRQPGKTLVATAGVHGDEYEGVRAILEVFQQLEPGKMSGDFLAVPVANPPAFWNGTRTSPLDGGNLARVFPGDVNKGPTSAIAWNLGSSIISRADLYVDLHSAGVRWLMPTMVGYDSRNSHSRDAAFAFGARVMWGHPTIAPGRTVTFAAEQNIPWLYTEARGAGRIDLSDLRVFVGGLINLLRHLGILKGKARRAKAKFHLYGDGNTDEGLKAGQRGFLVPLITLLQEVHTGDVLGKLYSLHAETLETYRSPRDGVVAMIREFPVVESGEPLFLVTGVHPRALRSERKLSKNKSRRVRSAAT